MSFFSDKISKEVEFTNLIDACIMQLQAVRYHTNVKADERDKAVQQVQNTIPMIRRYLTYFRTKELEAKK